MVKSVSVMDLMQQTVRRNVKGGLLTTQMDVEPLIDVEVPFQEDKFVS